MYEATMAVTMQELQARNMLHLPHVQNQIAGIYIRLLANAYNYYAAQQK